MAEIDADQWLRQHHLCSFATGRRDGSPQLTLVGYGYDGTDLVISTTSDRPKYLNTKRQPKIALLVQEGRQYVLVYGRVEHVLSDPERLELMKRTPGFNRRVERLGGDMDAVVAELNAEKRIILRVLPDRIIPHD
jgi:PPOX class probable F420-dependent enzyme